MLLLQIPRQWIAVIGSLSASIGITCCDPSPYEQTINYHTRLDATRDGAFERGWLPHWLPASSKNIWETHDLDSNAVYFKFNFDRDKIDDWLKASEAVLIPENLHPKLPLLKETWWPKNIHEGKAFTVKMSNENDFGMLVIDYQNSVAMCWLNRATKSAAPPLRSKTAPNVNLPAPK